MSDLMVTQDYGGLRRAVSARRRELGLSQLALDDLTGLPDGYAGKLECGSKHFGPLSLTS